MGEFTCYQCQLAATSREHVPPKCLFPEAKDALPGAEHRRNLIAVPSCDLHNSAKSKDDAFLFWVLTVPLQGNAHKQQQFSSKGMRAFHRRPETFLRFMENLTPVQLQMPDGSYAESAAFEVDLARFDRCLRHIALGLFFHHTGRKWSAPVRVYTDAFMALTGAQAAVVNAHRMQMHKAIAEALTNEQVHGENPSIFRYKFMSDALDRHVFHMQFYEGVTTTAILVAA